MEQQNKYCVVVSARAAQMLVSHAAFLAQASPAAAERLTVEFEKAAKSLVSFIVGDHRLLLHLCGSQELSVSTTIVQA